MPCIERGDGAYVLVTTGNVVPAHLADRPRLATQRPEDKPPAKATTRRRRPATDSPVLHT